MFGVKWFWKYVKQHMSAGIYTIYPAKDDIQNTLLGYTCISIV